MHNNKQTNFDPNRGIPFFPVYGYDSCEDADCDFDYMKFLYPSSARKMQSLVEEECDKLEYSGSCMFDEYPDRLQVYSLADRIYKQVEYELPDLAATGRRYPEQRPCCRDDNWLHNAIEVMLINEMVSRRRRYRSRNRWY